MMDNLLHPDLKNPGSQLSIVHHENQTVIHIKGWSGNITVHRPEKDIFEDNGEVKPAHISSFSWSADTDQEALDILVGVAYAVKLMRRWNSILAPAATTDTAAKA